MTYDSHMIQSHDTVMLIMTADGRRILLIKIAATLLFLGCQSFIYHDSYSFAVSYFHHLYHITLCLYGHESERKSEAPNRTFWGLSTQHFKGSSATFERAVATS